MQMTWENPDDIVEKLYKVLQELPNGKPISDLQPLISERIICFDSCQFLWIKRVDICVKLNEEILDFFPYIDFNCPSVTVMWIFVKIHQKLIRKRQ